MTGDDATAIIRRIKRLQTWLGEELLSTEHPPQLTDYAYHFLDVAVEAFAQYKDTTLDEDRKRVRILNDGAVLLDGIRTFMPQAVATGNLLASEKKRLEAQDILAVTVSGRDTTVARMRRSYKVFDLHRAKLKHNLRVYRLRKFSENSAIIKKLVFHIEYLNAACSYLDEAYGPFKTVDPHMIVFPDT